MSCNCCHGDSGDPTLCLCLILRQALKRVHSGQDYGSAADGPKMKNREWISGTKKKYEIVEKLFRSTRVRVIIMGDKSRQECTTRGGAFRRESE